MLRSGCYHEQTTGQMTPSPGRPSPPRLILYLFFVVLFCPVRYWGLGSDVDSTWRFALNFAAVHGLVAGRDIVFTYGRWDHLLFPEHTGHNLEYGLAFQAVLWIVLAAILADVFFRSGVRVRNLGQSSALVLRSPHRSSGSTTRAAKIWSSPAH